MIQNIPTVYDWYARHIAHARKLGGTSPVGQRNSVRQRKVYIAQAAGVPFSVVDQFAKRQPVPEDQLARLHIAMRENWWE